MTLFLYQLFFPFVAAAVLFKFLLAGRGASLREGLEDLRQRLGLPREELLRVFESHPARSVLWIHAASVGEALATAPLLAALSRRKERPRIVMTTSTGPGREKARTLPGVDLALLAPVDLRPCVSAFLERLRPSSLLLIETELWPMTLHLARRRGLRLGLANGRMTSRAFGRYRLLHGFFSGILSLLDRAALQTQDDARRYQALGLRDEAALVAGNMKYDVGETPAHDDTSGKLAKLGWAGAPVWAAGSTRRGEEEILLEAHKAAARKRPDLRLILAPRHPERCGEAADLLKRAGLGFLRWSELEAGAAPPSGGTDCLLVDGLGVLGSLYAWAFAAFVGGTLVPVGGHNLLEPARLGCPVLFGPHTANTQEPAEALRRSGGGTLVEDATQIETLLAGWLDSPVRRSDAGEAAKRTAREFTGATTRTLAHLEPVLFPSKAP